MPCPTADTERAIAPSAGKCPAVSAEASHSYVTGPSNRLAGRIRNDASFAAIFRAAVGLPFAWSARTTSPSLSGTGARTVRSTAARGAVTTGADNVSRWRSPASSSGARRRSIAEPATSAWYTRHGDGCHSTP